MLGVIGIRCVAAIGNIITIVLNGLMFGNIESGRIIVTDRSSGVAATNDCTVIISGNIRGTGGLAFTDFNLTVACLSPRIKHPERIVAIRFLVNKEG